MKGKFYKGERKENGVIVQVALPKKERDPWFKPLTHVSYHSPDGCEWGYGGSGPSDLSLAILTDWFEEDPLKVQTYARTGQGDPSSAVHFHRQFTNKFIIGLPKNTWRITDEEIKTWFLEVGALCKECKRGMHESDGCQQFAIPMKDGDNLAPVKHGEETRADWGRDGGRCHDCGAKVGHFHHPGCDVEECPKCGGQLIGCSCVKYAEEEEE